MPTLQEEISRRRTFAIPYLLFLDLLNLIYSVNNIVLDMPLFKCPGKECA